MATEVTSDQQKLLSVLLSSGRYETEEAVLNEALALLRQRDELRGLLQAGVAQLDVGERVPAADALRQLRSGLPAES